MGAPIGNKNSLGSPRSHTKEWKKAQRDRMKGNTRKLGFRKDVSLLKVNRIKAYDTQYKRWMLEVKNRDCWKCKINNKDCKGRLEAHHILTWLEHPELRYEINNGITLCLAHHPRKRSEEAKLSPFFQSLVTEMK